MIESAEQLLSQPLRSVAELSAADIPVEPGVYAWYQSGRLFYVGESHRGLRSRVWGNHLRGNSRSSTLRNKLAKALDFRATAFRAYGRDAEKVISAKLLDCEIRFLPLPAALIDQVQAELIREHDPPMNDHPGRVPRWKMDETREILNIASGATNAPTPTNIRGVMPAGLTESQRVTRADVLAGRIRFPRPAKGYFPTERCSVSVVLRGLQLDARYDPRTGPDKERSAVLLVGKSNLEKLVRAGEVLSISIADGIVRLD
ncbi:MAG: hypothetical protein M3R70_06075 [Actinomycetota bacterium]|nr:hypothetical protein [Actinomycetota bacterium]